jgi:signal transduction histidine kinase
VGTIGFRGLATALLLLIGLITSPAATWARDLVSAKAYFEDGSAALPFADIPRQVFTPYEGVFSHGYSASNFWFRLTIDPARALGAPLASTDKVVLRVRPPYLREVEFFDPAHPEQRRRLSGDLHSASGDEYRSFNLTFVMPVGDGPRDVYVRMATSSSTLIKFDAYAMDEVGAVDFRQGVFFSLYISFLILSLLLALFLLTVNRSTLIMLFGVRQFIATLWAVAIYGIYRYADFPYGPGPMHFMISTVLCVTFISELFDYRLFRTFRVPQTFSRIQLLLMTFPLVGMGLALFGEIRTAMIVNVVSALCFSLVTMVSSYFCFPARSGNTDAAELPRWVIALSYTVICGFLLSTLFPQLGLYAGSEFAVYSLAFHTALSTTLVSIIIARRAKRIHDEKLLLDHQLQRTQSALLIEAAAREDQSALLAMLSHELKTPLAAMKMMLGDLPAREGGYGQINDAIAEMNSLVDRCLYVGKIEEGVIVTNTSRIDVGQALRERLLAAGAADRVDASIASDLVINTDPQLMGIVFANLIDNARKYSAPGTPIRIEATHQPDGGVAVEISNQPRLGRWPDAAALFSKYYRAASSHNVIGSGLGLFLSQRLAEHLGGGIAYEPTDTEVRFRLWLPG